MLNLNRSSCSPRETFFCLSSATMTSKRRIIASHNRFPRVTARHSGSLKHPRTLCRCGVTASEPDTSNAAQTVPTSSAGAPECRHVAASSTICLSPPTPSSGPPRRDPCFTKRLVNISAGTRRRQEGREGAEKRQEKTICAGVVSASSV